MLIIIPAVSLVFSFIFAFAKRPLSYRLIWIAITFVTSTLLNLRTYVSWSLIKVGGAHIGQESMSGLFANIIIAFFAIIFASIATRRLWSIKTAYFLLILFAGFGVYRAIESQQIRSLLISMGIFASSCLVLAGLFFKKQWARFGAGVLIIIFACLCVVGVYKGLIRDLSHGKFEPMGFSGYFAVASVIIFLIICGISLIKSDEISQFFSTSSGVSAAND